MWDLSAMPRQRFVISCSFGCQGFTLKEDGSQEEKSFASIVDALEFARRKKAELQARVAVLSPFGGVMMETII
jgi:hypothetical protein